MDDLLNEFLIETTENLSLLDGQLVRLEQDPNDPELLSNIFRLVHTIKGTCGFLGLPRLEAVAHAAENVLDKFRDGEMQISAAAVTLILEALDRVKLIVAGLEESESEPEGDDGTLIEALNRLSETGGAEAATPSPAPTTRQSTVKAVLSLEEDDGTAAEIQEAPVDSAASERPLWDRLGGLSSIDAAIDVYYGKVMGDPTLQPLFAGLVLDEVKGHQRDYLSEIAGGPDKFHADDPRIGHPQLGAPGLEEGHFATLADYFLESLQALEIDAATRDELMAVLDLKRNQIVENSAVATPAAAAAPAPEAPTAPAPGAAKEPSVAAQNIRVNVELLETLMTMVSELVLTRNQLMQILRGRDDDSEFGAPLQRLSHVTTELQEGVMKTRMQPIGNAWAKLPRIVRDLSIELDRKIELQMLGAETELDRQVLELIRDPLTHMVRNSADHGIESPAERRAAGKPDTGTITLNAYHEGGHIIIEISDDGRGLDVAKIKAKAIKNGIASEAELEGLSDQQIQQYIFKAGFSTAERVTAVSGRGVGMDVVRTNIERIGGNVELKSTAGKGSKFIIKIPLTLAIVSALLVEAAGERFAIPQISVLELVRASGNSEQTIEYINDTPVLRLRNRLLPLVSLRDLLQLHQPAAAESADATLYERFGGAAGIRAAVALFYDKMLADENLRQIFENVDIDMLKASHGAFFAMALGGPDNDTGADPRAVHRHVITGGLNETHFERMTHHLDEVLGELGIEAGLREQVLAALDHTAEPASAAEPMDQRFILVTQVGAYSFGIIVDRVFDTEEIVVKPVVPILRDISLFSGNTILGDGSVIMILDPNGIAAVSGEVTMRETVAAEQATGFDARGDNKTSLLLFKAGDEAVKAVPLALVARLEEFESDKIEVTNGQPVVQYRGGLMPLVTAVAGQETCRVGRQPVLVFSDKDRSMGLLVDEIVDIVDETLDVQQPSGTPGVMGSAIIAGKATELIDAEYFLTQAFGDWFTRAGEAGEKSQPRRVLVVDDSPFFRNMLTPLLQASGYDVTSVESANQALELCEAGADFEVIVSDIDMPEMSGFEFAEAVRSGSRWQDMPLVALSSITSPEALDRGREVGFTDYVAKSDRDALLDTLAQTIAASGGAA